jgi:hypothetical protein
MSAVEVNSIEEAYGQPAGPATYTWARIVADRKQLASILLFLAEDGVAFTYEKYIGGEHEIVVNAEDRHVLENAIKEAQ